MSWEDKVFWEWRNYKGRTYSFINVHQSLSGPETIEMSKTISASKTFNHIYSICDYGAIETILTDAERSQALEFRLSGGVTKLVYAFVINQPYYEPLKLAYRMLIESKGIDASFEVFQTREDAERYLFALLDSETIAQRELGRN